MIAVLALPSAHEINKQLPALHFTKYRRGSCASAYHGNVLGKSQMPAEVWLLFCTCSLVLPSNPAHWHGSTGCLRCLWPGQDVDAISCPSPPSGRATFIQTQTKEKLWISEKPRLRERKEGIWSTSSFLVMDPAKVVDSAKVSASPRAGCHREDQPEANVQLFLHTKMGLLGAPSAGQGCGSWEGEANSSSPTAGIISPKEGHSPSCRTSAGKTEKVCVQPSA